MDKAALTSLFNSFIHPTQLVVILRDLLFLTNELHSNKIHLQAAIDWLCRAQDESGCGGCSASFGFDHGWAPPYPETTGYIIPTFLRYAELIKDDSYVERAKRMGDWEIEIQLPSGGVRGGVGINEYPIVFNTGMVVLGWTDLYCQTGYDRYLSASVKAADWLCSIIENDGRWINYSYQGIPHAYHSRVSWSLLEVYKHTNNSKYKDAAIRNISWVLSLVQEDGWIENMGFTKEEKPFTHTIAYTLRGLLESSFFFNEEIKLKIQNTVIRTAKKIMSIYEDSNENTYSKLKLLPGNMDRRWQSTARFSCLTGNAQIALIWLKIYQLNKDARYLNAAVNMINHLKHVQNLKSTNPGIRGGIAGSIPIWGSYMQFSYPNWAAKFYADALILLETLMNEI